MVSVLFNIVISIEYWLCFIWTQPVLSEILCSYCFSDFLILLIFYYIRKSLPRYSMYLIWINIKPKNLTQHNNISVQTEVAYFSSRAYCSFQQEFWHTAIFGNLKNIRIFKIWYELKQNSCLRQIQSKIRLLKSINSIFFFQNILEILQSLIFILLQYL